MAAESVDVEKLFDDIMKSNPTIAQLNAMFTSKHGNRAKAVADNYDGFVKDKNDLENIPEDRAERFSKDLYSGVYGDFTRMVGSVETLLTKVGQDFEGITRPIMQGVDALASALTDAPQGIRQMTAAAVAFATAMAAFGVAKGVAGFFGGAAAGGAAGVAGGAAGGIAGLLAGGGKAVAGVAGSSAGLGLAGLLAAYYGLSKAFPDTDKGKPPVKWYDQGADANRTNNWKQTHGVQFEGGLHRSMAPGGLLPGNFDRFEQYKAKAIETGRTSQEALNFTAFPQINLSSINALIASARAASASIANIGGGGPRTSGGQSDVRPMPVSKVSSSVMGRRKHGGSVAAGKEYIVGEDGAERVRFNQNGYVSPNKGSGSSSSIGVVNNYITSTDPHAAAREVERSLASLLSRSSDLAIDGRMG